MNALSRRLFLFGIGTLPLAGAAKRKTSVLADLGGSIDIDRTLLSAIHGAGFDGFIQSSPEARLKLKPQDYGALQLYGIRSALPRFEDSMDDAAGEVKTLAGLASVQGAGALITTHPGLSGNGAFRPLDLERKARMLGIAGSICANRGLTFFYQNQSLEFTGNAAEERGLMARTDVKQVSFLLDTGEAMRAGADVAAFFEANQKRIGGLLLTDFKDDGLVPFGQGHLPAGAMASAMQKARWSGWLVAPLNIDKDQRAAGGFVESFKATRELIRKSFGV
jgi:sugar phosphate isomerase/epimerase